MRLTGLEHHRSALPIHEVGGSKHPRAVVAIHFSRRVKVIGSLVADHRRIRQVPRQDRVLICAGNFAAPGSGPDGARQGNP